MATSEERRAREGDPTHPDVDHEDRDVRTRPILLFLGALLILAAVVHVGLWVLQTALIARERAQDPPPSPLAAEAPRVPPEPRLQANPLRDMEALREREERQLRSYGWVDESAGVVRIPIERAMELLVERGEPAAATDAGAPVEPAP